MGGRVSAELYLDGRQGCTINPQGTRLLLELEEQGKTLTGLFACHQCFSFEGERGALLMALTK